MPTKDLRKQLRQARRALSEDARSTAAKQLQNHISQLPPWSTAQTISSYLSFDGEISTQPLHLLAWRQAKSVVLPILDHNDPGQLVFHKYNADSPMRSNSFGITEPVLDEQKKVTLDNIDIMLIPLVGFDKHANRMGMGGGFYDRTLAKIYSNTSRPLLIGVAHNCQEVAQLTPAKWDIPMDYIVTDRKVISRI